MRDRRLLGLCAALFALISSIPATHAQYPDAARPTLEGFVTDPGTPALYRVNDVVVHCDPSHTNYSVMSADGRKKLSHRSCPQFLIGQTIRVFGERTGKHGDLAALDVEPVPPQPLTVHGLAVIDRVLTPFSNGSITVRADGYPILLTPKTNVVFDKSMPLSLAAAQPNTWLTYIGTLGPDGVVQATSAELAPNTISNGEEGLRRKNEFDASAVEQSERQSAAARYLLGVNTKRLPAHHDDLMQTRVDAIGQRLIPAYQKQLAPNDPTRIDFRFQIVEEPKYAYFALPSGILLVSHEAIEGLQDESQVAAVLASGIAEVLQKRALRAQTPAHAITASRVAGAAAGLFIPGADLPFLLANHEAGDAMVRHAIEQNSRVSLALMHDAGFDIREAPRAWWLLAEKKNTPLSETRMPYITQYLYSLLFTVWQTTPTQPASAAM